MYSRIKDIKLDLSLIKSVGSEKRKKLSEAISRCDDLIEATRKLASEFMELDKPWLSKEDKEVCDQEISDLLKQMDSVVLFKRKQGKRGKIAKKLVFTCKKRIMGLALARDLLWKISCHVQLENIMVFAYLADEYSLKQWNGVVHRGQFLLTPRLMEFLRNTHGFRYEAREREYWATFKGLFGVYPELFREFEEVLFDADFSRKWSH